MIRFSKYSDSSEYAVIFTDEPVIEDISSNAGIYDLSSPIDTGTLPAEGMRFPQAYSPAMLKRLGKKRRYRVVRRRRLDDMVFVF